MIQIGPATTRQASSTTRTNNTPVPPSDPGPTPVITPGSTDSTVGDDNLIGTNGPDRVSLLSGNDTYAGGPGNDVIYGNLGNDSLSGEWV